MKATATVQVQSPTSGNQFSLQIALKLPDSAYIKIEGILGIDGLKASLNRETYVVYNIMNKTVSLGSTSPRAIRKTFDMDVSFDDMMGLLLGLPKIQKNDLDSLTEFSAEESYYVMTIHRHDHKQKIWFDPFADYAISKVVDYDLSGEISMEREFTRFYKEGDAWFPRYVRLTRPQKQDLLSLYFEERQLDKTFPSSLFIIRYPKDAEILKN